MPRRRGAVPPVEREGFLAGSDGPLAAPPAVAIIEVVQENDVASVERRFELMSNAKKLNVRSRNRHRAGLMS